MNKTIAIIKGDGIGPEIVTEAMAVLDPVGAGASHLRTETALRLLREVTLQICLSPRWGLIL